jgi:glycosidase
MKIGTLIACLLMALTGHAQLLSWSPDFIQESSATIEITTDATLGNQGLKDYATTTDVYVHIGCITNLSTSSSDWKYSKFTWASTTIAANCTYLGNNKWKYTITGGLRTFFGITNANEKVLKIAILFRNGAGAKVQRNADGSDMYVPVYEAGLNVRIDNPFRQPLYNPIPEYVNWTIGNNVAMLAKSSESASLKLFFNGTQVANASSATQISNTQSITSTGTQTIIAEATNGTTIKRDTINFFVTITPVVADPPTGLKQGITYETGDTSAYLLLFAPTKTSVSVIGDFNNWTETVQHQLKKSVDGRFFWTRLTGLTSGIEYAYQFVIDGNLKVADYNAEKILDPSNDQYISSTTYPALKPYPVGKTTGIVSVLQTAKPTFNWTATNYTRPNKKNLTIYELLVRDFVATQNWNTLRDTLTYLKRLGVNTIELMPFNEFEGNNSWGYNPSFYFAPDKAYGTENALKAFIDSCHKMNIAVVMDIAMNHSFGQSPMVQMYFNSAAGKPAANSPWFNQDATHPYNVGYDFNHESQATKDFVDRVIEHWLTKYKIDGFRWDLSKGFTQVNNPNNVGAWGNYDASRIAIWKRIYDKMQAVNANSYCILEHFADNSEEIELSNYGMLLWGNSNYNFNQATMGFNSGSDFQSAIHVNRGWTNPHLIAYQESHDEERLMYKNVQFGNSNTSYNVRDLNTALKRNEAATAFWTMIPGPKMLWQFGETGYDFSINTCENLTVDPNNCRLSPKPIRWDYYNNPNRKSLYDVYSGLLRLKITPAYASTFTTNNVTWNLSSGFKWLILNEPALRILVMGNFDIQAQTGSVTFPTAGTWYNYFTGATFTATGSSQSLLLQPGEYYVYTDRNVSGTVVTPILNINSNLSNMKLKLYPNPANAATIIEYEIEESGKVELAVTDMNGKNIANLYSGFKARGKHQLAMSSNGFNVAKLAGGIYLLQTSINGKRKTEKFVIAQ